jgi:hypothetical protein
LENEKMNVKSLIAAATLLTSADAVFAGNANPVADRTGVVSSGTHK